MDKARVKPPTPAQKSTTRHAGCRHLRAPTHFRFPADHPVATPLGEMFPMRELTTVETTGQQRVAVLVADIGEVLARHTDAERPGALQTINEVPFLFCHQPLLMSSSSVLLLDGMVGSRRKNKETSVPTTVQLQERQRKRQKLGSSCSNKGVRLLLFR